MNLPPIMDHGCHRMFNVKNECVRHHLLGHKVLCFVISMYPRRTLDVPSTYLPSMYPRCTLDVPSMYRLDVNPRPSMSVKCGNSLDVPLTYPRCTLDVPSTYPRCTLDVPSMTLDVPSMPRRPGLSFGAAGAFPFPSGGVC